uniref:Ovule protein n=1 Tax=Steinernema glaseri TaxID=37863 RepID=A0A1I7ZG63_9BILA
MKHKRRSVFPKTTLLVFISRNKPASNSDSSIYGWSMLIEDMLTSTSPIDNLRKSSSMMTDGLTTDSSRKTIYDSAIYIHCSKLFARTTCLE